ncbi:MAG TPA: AraC family transcriptional regulator [Pseudoduganella sp.]|jgi:AraC family transcriptional regulator
MQFVPLLRPSSVCTDDTGKSLLSLPAHWRGLPLNLYRSAGLSECGPSHVSSPTLLLCVNCHGRSWHRQHGRTLERSGGPGMIDLYDSDYQREWARWDVTPGYTMGMTLTAELVERLLPELADFDLATVHGLRDPKLQWLMQELFEEIKTGAQTGALYAESLSCALLARLATCHRGTKMATCRAGALSPASRQRIADFIEAHLGEELGIVTLAQQVNLSPDHFARCFRISFGVTPHRYVQQRRIAAAQRMLAMTTRPLAEIALDLGFYSHTHFTRIFRQHTGTTPRRVRSA